MKRILLCLILVGLVIAGTPKPGEVTEPLPIEVKSVLVSVAKPWIITNDTGTHLIAYYQRVKMPDGMTQELKSRTPLTAEQWKALAQKQWDAQEIARKQAELAASRVCTRCGGSGVEPQ